MDLGKHFQNEPLFTAIGVDIDENNTSKVWGSPSSLPPTSVPVKKKDNSWLKENTTPFFKLPQTSDDVSVSCGYREIRNAQTAIVDFGSQQIGNVFNFVFLDYIKSSPRRTKSACNCTWTILELEITPHFMWTCRLRRKKTSTLLLALNEQPSSKQQATTSSVLRLGIHFNTDIEHETAFDVEKRSVEND